ncbi:hypothetical protein ABT075_38630 [Streptomyces sp. NPDC002677]
MERILVVGVTGPGKSTVAQTLSSRLRRFRRPHDTTAWLTTL